MNVNHYGMILYDGTILINCAYYGLSYSHMNEIIILFTLMNEIMHALSRLLRGKIIIFLIKVNSQKPIIKTLPMKVEFISKISFYLVF